MTTDGGPMFPCRQTTEVQAHVLDENNEPCTVPVVIEHCGISIRDHFAGQVVGTVLEQFHRVAEQLGYPEDWRLGVARDAYLLADAMLAARNEVKP